MADENKTEGQDGATEGTDNKPDTKPAEGTDNKPAEGGDGKGGDDGVTDSHGQRGINKERHDKEVKALQDKIDALQAQIDDAAKTEKAREDLKSEVQKARDEIKEEKLNWQLEKAGCKNLKAAKALLDDYEGDVSKLKKDCPYLFEAEGPKGSTGGKPGGASHGSTTIEEKIDKVFSGK